MSRYRRKQKNDIFERTIAYIPKSVIEILRETSEETNIPMSRLICIAIDNELDTMKPFNYPTVVPDEYQEFMYAKEARLLLNFLHRCPKGLGLDSIVLARRDVGVDSREDLLAAVKELLEQGHIKWVRPSDTRTRYPKGYKKLILTDMNKNTVRAAKFKRLEGVSQSNKKRKRSGRPLK